MKIKELKRTVNVSWSPVDQYPIMLAAGSAAQQVDASFSSSSHLDLYSLNLDDTGLDLELKSSLQTQQKFQKIVWSGAGVIIGGCDGGLLQFYNSEKLLKNASDALVSFSTKHTGHVSALDVNPYQKNLLASGASESEIFIWDLNNTSQPMAPGNKNQPFDHVQGLAWNQQVQHILGSTFATRCVVWDLRKNEPIMKLSDSQSRTRWRALSWHPSVATQLCIASEDDQVPVIQLWDLRLAASPLVTLEGHHKGVMSLSWCKQDPDLMLSAGKDGRVLCWNPNNTKPGGEMVCEVSYSAQWVYEVSWCPRSPSLLAASSFDQQLAIHALLAGSRPDTNSHSQSTIMESFGGAESFSQLPAVSRAPPAASAPAPLPPRPPKWLGRPHTARFSFGGKLVTFEKYEEAGSQRLVYVSQVVSEPELVERAHELDAVLGAALDPSAAGRLAEYCRARGDEATDQHERYTWFFMRANFLPTFRSEALNLLGFKQDEIPSKFKDSTALINDALNTATQLQQDSLLSRGESTETEAELSTDTSTDLSDAHTLIERKLSNLELESEPTVNDVVIPNGEDSTSLICRALVCGNVEEAVELCLDAKRIADALIIASLGSPELVGRVQQYYLSTHAREPVALLAGCAARARWATLVAAAAPRAWRHALGALLTHCDDAALREHALALGARLANDADAAAACYLCAPCPSALLRRWRAALPQTPDARTLASLVERALLVRAAAAHRTPQFATESHEDEVQRVVSEYAWRLAAQGCLAAALHALDAAAAGDGELRTRIAHAAGLVPQQKQQQQQRVSTQPMGRTRTGSGHVRHNDSSGQYSQKQTHFESNVWHQPPPAQSPSYALNSFVAPPAPPASGPPGGQFGPPGPTVPQLGPPGPPVPPAVSQPARPGSVGLNSGGITSRSKYKVDPSVQSTPLYNNYSFNNPIAQQPYGGYGSPMPDQYGSASVPNPGFMSNPGLNPSLNHAPINPDPLNAVPPNSFNSAPGTLNGDYYNPGQPTQQQPVVPKAAPVAPAAPGWNDPPIMTSKPKYPGDVGMGATHAGTRRWALIIEHRRTTEEAKPAEMPAQAPITHPLFGAEPPQHVPLTGPYPGQQLPGQQLPGQQLPGQLPGQFPGQQLQGQFPGQQLPGQYPVQQYSGQQYDQQHQPSAYQSGASAGNAPYTQQTRPAAEPSVPVAKAPLPEELAPIQLAFDALAANCSARADTPQLKRKLEDVQRRLEALYDALREGKLSAVAVASLSHCAGMVRQGEWAAAAHAATSLASGTDFAAAAAFLPGLKVLLQLAQHMQLTPR